MSGCCSGYTNSTRTREVVCPIQHGREYYKVLVSCDTNGCKRSYSSKILEIGMILGEKIERKVYVNQQKFVSDIQLLIKYSFILSFLHELLTILQREILHRPYS